MTLATKRNIALYAFLTSSVIFGVVDILLYTNADWDSISLVLNTIIGTILILVGCRYDARLQNYPLSGGNSVLVWAFPVIGVPVYLVRSRGWTPAAKIGFGLPIFALSIGLYYASWYGTRLIAEHAGYFV